MSDVFQKLISTPFGSLVIVWRKSNKTALIHRILLSNETLAADQLGKQIFPNAVTESCEVIDVIATQIQQFLKGENIQLDLDVVDFYRCTSFQRRVLTAEHGVIRGWVTTYQKLATYLGDSKCARAVGTALKNNPFPIIIPCHRAIRSDGSPGGFQGGIKMKRALLEMEGIEFFRNGKVKMDKVYY